MIDLPDDDQWRCRFVVTGTERCAFPADKDGLCWLHRPKQSLDVLQRASQIAGILTFIWKFLEWYRGVGDGIRIDYAMTANMEDFREAIREQDEARIDELTSHILCTVVPKFVPTTGLTWAMIRRVGEHVAKPEGVPANEWTARLARSLPEELREDLRGTRWAVGALPHELPDKAKGI
jgi:hypothetical protein